MLHEDDELLTLEVAKDNERKVRVEEGDRFLTLLFVHQDEEGLEVWLPWQVTEPPH